MKEPEATQAITGDATSPTAPLDEITEGSPPETLPAPTDIPAPLGASPADPAAVPLVINPENDHRQRVTNTGLAPVISLALILSRDHNNRLYMGTGWFFLPNLLVTAGHVLFDHENNPKKMKDAFVLPRHNNSIPNASELFSGIHATPDQFRLTDGWVNDGANQEEDYAAIVLPDLGEPNFATDWAFNDRMLGGSPSVVIAGYPCTPPGGGVQGTMWLDTGTIAGSNTGRIFYGIDTSRGQSGTAVAAINEQGNYSVLGIHNYGLKRDGKRFNAATRINQRVFNQLLEWAGRSPV